MHVIGLKYGMDWAAETISSGLLIVVEHKLVRLMELVVESLSSFIGISWEIPCKSFLKCECIFSFHVTMSLQLSEKLA